MGNSVCVKKNSIEHTSLLYEHTSSRFKKLCFSFFLVTKSFDGLKISFQMMLNLFGY